MASAGTSPASNVPRAFRALNAWRFCAAFGVFASHLLFLRKDLALGPWYQNVLEAGTTGVTLFFVLSGFVLMHAYGERLAQLDRAAAGRYLRARFARIWPLHALTTGVAVWLGGAALLQAHGRDLALSLALVHAWLPLPGGVGVYNPISWTISHEVFFYLLFPLLVPLIRRSPPWLPWLPLGVTAALALAIPTPMPGLFLYQPLARLAEFLAGIGLYRLALHERPEGSTARHTGYELGALGLFALTLALRPHLPINLGYSALFVPAYASIILAFACERGLIARALARPLPVYLGDLSYAFYLWHVLVLGVLLGAYPGLGAVPFALAAGVTTLALAAVSHHAVENPLRARLGDPAFPLGRLVRWTASLSLLAVVLSAAVTRGESLWRQVSAFSPTWGVLAVGGTLLGYALTADRWRRWLAGLRLELTFSQAFQAMYQANLAKYLPGAGWHYLGRAALASRRGVPPEATAATMALDEVLVLATGAIVGVPLMLAAGGGVATADLPWLAVGVCACMAALHPRALQAALTAAAKVLGRPAIDVPYRHRFVGAMALHAAASWLIHGLAFAALGQAFSTAPLSPTQLALLIGALPCAWAAGALVVVAPAGLGVREAVLVLLLAPAFPPGWPALLALASRTWFMAADVLAFLAAYGGSAKAGDGAVTEHAPDPGV